MNVAGTGCGRYGCWLTAGSGQCRRRICRKTVWTARTRRTFAAALEGLAPRQGEALHLVFYQDMSLSEAGVMGVAVGLAEMQQLGIVREIITQNTDGSIKKQNHPG